jgi:hypothetical protein
LNPGFPDSVDYIITHICMICHSDQSDNERARFKLNFSKWDEMKGLAQIGKLDNISKMLREDKMPPPKFIERNPSKALTESQRALMIHWADDEIKKLMKP